MTYIVLKAVHVVAVIVWMAGMLIAPLLLRILASLKDGERALVAHRFYAAFKLLNTPAMLLTLALGVYLMVQGGWTSYGWMHLKLGIVFGLSGLHGFYSARLRKVGDGAPVEPGKATVLLGVNIAAITAISLLVILKPG